MSYLRGHTLARHLLLTVAAAIVLLLLTYGLSPYRNFQLATMAAYLCATAGLTLLVGLTGQLSLGHGALMAVGAYSFALLANRLGENGTTGIVLVVLPLVAAVVVTAAVGGIIGLAGARLSGPYLAGLTLTLTIIVPSLTTTFADTLGGDQGLSVYVEPAPVALGAAFPLERWQAWLACLAALLTMLLLTNLTHSRFGRDMRAVRDDEVASRLAGIAVGRTKVVAFVVSSATAGLGGGMLALMTQAVSPGAFSLSFSLFLLMAVVVGGLGHLAGAVWGAALLVVLPDLTNAVADHLPLSNNLAARMDGNLALLVFGVVLVLVTIVFPSGIQGVVSVAGARIRRLRGSASSAPPVHQSHPENSESLDA